MGLTREANAAGPRTEDLRGDDLSPRHSRMLLSGIQRRQIYFRRSRLRGIESVAAPSPFCISRRKNSRMLTLVVAVNVIRSR